MIEIKSSVFSYHFYYVISFEHDHSCSFVDVFLSYFSLSI